jgi:hypothetical protein
VSDDNVKWTKIIDKSTNTEDLPHDYIQLEKPVEATLVKIVNVRVPETMKFSLYGLRIFGKQDRPPPAAPANLVANRHTDTRSVTLTWTASPTAIGYNIRFGVDPKKLYQNYIAYGRTSLDINALLAHQDYWFTIDAYNEGGITEGTVIVGPKVITPAPTKSKAPPTIARVSSPSWGAFPATGPPTDQVIEYTLADPDANQTWRLTWRFDQETFRAGAATPAIGTNSYSFPKTAFTGSRVVVGSHSASIQVTNSGGGTSNVISVSYSIAAPAGVTLGPRRGVVGGIAAVVGIAGVALAMRRRKRLEEEMGELA